MRARWHRGAHLRIYTGAAAWFSAFLTLLLTAAALHPIHISVTDGAFSAEDQRLQLAVRLFTDDLEDAIKQQTGVRYHLGTPDTLPGAEAAVKAYLRDHLRFQLPNGQTRVPAWVGFEGDLKATWCYLVVEELQDPEGLRVTNRLQFELYEDQSNLVHIKHRGVIKSGRTTHSSPTATFRWR